MFLFADKSPLFVITGPESSGKTTLAEMLTTVFGIPYTSEYARKYLGDRSIYSASDVYRIAMHQYQAINSHPPSLIQVADTDVLTCIIWLEWRFGHAAKWLERLWLAHLPAAYLICKPDIPWVADPLRANPYDREILFEKYIQKIQSTGVKYHIISGDRQSRLQHAILAIQEYVPLVSNKKYIDNALCHFPMPLHKSQNAILISKTAQDS